tara:strand:+ start:1827 stop:2777 length:951 start_codon:yes stop_codon:yes gene_type:complete
MQRLLVIDALNLLFRNYIVNPSLSTNGQPIGGLKGFLQSLQKLCRETKPDQIVICWDGAGGSQRRKSVVKSYKAGRKPLRLNRDIRNLSEAEEIENKIWQQQRVIEYLNEMPIIQLMIDATEADDIISHIVQAPKYSGWQKVIVSSDKDFYQLCDEETVLYRPIQKEILNKNTITERDGIHPTNYALARAIAGDKSDNLPGVGRVGLKTVANRLPFLREDKTYTLDYVLDYCQNVDSKATAYTNIVENFETVKTNYKIMQLYSPSIPVQGKMRINNTLHEYVDEFNKTEIRKMMITDGFGHGNWDDLFQTMQRFCA